MKYREARIIRDMITKLHIGLVLAALAVSMGQAVPPATAPATGAAGELKRVAESDFGKLADGTAIKCFTLANAKGMKARVVTLGAVIAGIQAPDKAGKLTNVVACADSAAAMQSFNLRAQTIGRVANRIGNGGKFTLEGKEYTVPGGGRGPVLHSGNANFGTKVWEGQALPAKEHEGAAQMTYVSPDGDGGFPGKLTLKVTFTLNDDNEFKLEYEATSDKTTVINVTNHAYFNLSGAQGWGNTAQGQIAEEELWVDADQILATQNLLPTGPMTEVKGTAYDFNKAAAIGARNTTYDTPYVLKNGGKVATVARLRDAASGREMEVRTDQPGLQVYTGQRTAIALETQHHPDSPNHPEFPTTTLKAGETFRTTTVYAFAGK
jgi:aldose 1-epimerase